MHNICIEWELSRSDFLRNTFVDFLTYPKNTIPNQMYMRQSPEPQINVQYWSCKHWLIGIAPYGSCKWSTNLGVTILK